MVTRIAEYTADEKTINKENIIGERDSMFEAASDYYMAQPVITTGNLN